MAQKSPPMWQEHFIELLFNLHAPTLHPQPYRQPSLQPREHPNHQTSLQPRVHLNRQSKENGDFDNEDGNLTGRDNAPATRRTQKKSYKNIHFKIFNGVKVRKYCRIK